MYKKHFCLVTWNLGQLAKKERSEVLVDGGQDKHAVLARGREVEKVAERRLDVVERLNAQLVLESVVLVDGAHHRVYHALVLNGRQAAR